MTIKQKVIVFAIGYSGFYVCLICSLKKKNRHEDMVTVSEHKSLSTRIFKRLNLEFRMSKTVTDVYVYFY